jgi:hypothetical protein
VDDRLTKILEEQQKLIADLAQHTNSTPPSQANVNQVGQQLPISDLHWNSNELPNPVLPRFNVRKTYLSHKQMEPFAIENKDANGIVIGTVDMNHYLHTKHGTNLQKLITRSGDCFDLSPLDDNKKVFEKQFLSGFPKLDGEEAAEVRKWYRAIVGRAKQYHMYIHPYYNFRRDVNHYRGFTLGDNFPDDVPQRYNTAIDNWGTLLHKALCQDKVIPDSCATMKATVQNFEDGNGYEALWGVIKSTHPHHLRSYETNELVRSYPQQQEGERIEHYYFRFNDHLQLKSYLRHPCSLDDPQEISALIGGCINCIELRHRSKYERENPHQLHKYTSGNILGTLQTFETEIEFEKKQKRAERPRRSIPPTIPRRTTTSRFSKPSRYSSDRTASTATSSITTQSVNLIDFVGLPEEDTTVLPDIWDAYIGAIKTLERNPREFDISRKCLICGETGHAFATCPILNNVPSLKDHRIALGQFLNKVRFLEQKDQQKDIEARQKRISQLMATAVDEDEDYEKIEEDDTDFQLGRE